MTPNTLLPTPPALPALTWRSARREDTRAIHRLLLDIETVDKRGSVDSLENIERNFDDPDTDVETDTLLAVTPEGQVAALGWIFSPPVGQTEYIAYLWGEVHPDYRQCGLGDFILTWLEERGAQILTTRPRDLPYSLRTSCQDILHDRIALFEQHGFKHVRSSYRMRRDLRQPIPDRPLPMSLASGGITLRQWSPELDRPTMEAWNESFSDHWGFIPVNEEVWKLWFTGHPMFRQDLSFLAMTGEGEIAGFCLNRVSTDEIRATGIKEGWIQELGVRRPWRKKGLATALLCASMSALKADGLEYAALGVDAENLTGALRIYERVGFTVLKRFMTFSKSVEK